MWSLSQSRLAIFLSPFPSTEAYWHSGNMTRDGNSKTEKKAELERWPQNIIFYYYIRMFVEVCLFAWRNFKMICFCMTPFYFIGRTLYGCYGCLFESRQRSRHTPPLVHTYINSPVIHAPVHYHLFSICHHREWSPGFTKQWQPLRCFHCPCWRTTSPLVPMHYLFTHGAPCLQMQRRA